MAKLDTLTFVGQSGHKYRFKVYSWGHELKPLPAVYVVTERVVEPDAPPTYSPSHWWKGTSRSTAARSWGTW